MLFKAKKEMTDERVALLPVWQNLQQCKAITIIPKEVVMLY